MGLFAVSDDAAWEGRGLLQEVQEFYLGMGLGRGWVGMGKLELKRALAGIEEGRFCYVSMSKMF